MWCLQNAFVISLGLGNYYLNIAHQLQYAIICLVDVFLYNIFVLKFDVFLAF